MNNDHTLKYTLTETQRKFLERVQDDSHFGFVNPFNLTIAIILKQGMYSNCDKENLNDTVIPNYKAWKNIK
jgi:hypothetical protein